MVGLTAPFCAICEMSFDKGAILMERTEGTVDEDEFGANLLSLDMLKWLDQVVCIKKRGTSSDEAIIGDTIAASTEYFVTKPGSIAQATVLSIKDLPSDVTFTSGGPFSTWTASGKDPINTAPQRFLNIYWGSTGEDIVFPLHQSCARLANRYIQVNNWTIDKLYCALRSQYFYGLGEGRISNDISSVHRDPLPYEFDLVKDNASITEEIVDIYDDLPDNEDDPDETWMQIGRGRLTHNNAFSCDHGGEDYISCYSGSEYCAADPCGAISADGKTLWEQILTAPIKACTWWGEKFLPPGLFYHNFHGRESAPARDEIPTVKLPDDNTVQHDRFWRLPVEIRTMIMTRMPSIESVTALRLSSRAFATIPFAPHVWKNLLFGLQWMWDLELPSITDSEIDWKSVYYDVSRNDKGAVMTWNDNNDLLNPLIGLFNRRRIWWVLEKLQERYTQHNASAEQKAIHARILPLMLKEFHNRVKRLHLLEKQEIVGWASRE